MLKNIYIKISVILKKMFGISIIINPLKVKSKG